MRASSTVLKVFKLRLEQDQDDDFVLAHALALLKWRWWVHPINQGRRQHGAYNPLVRELLFDGDRFQRFSLVLHFIGPRLSKQSTTREANTPRERLAVCMT